jgi:hypothetical protein
VTHATPAIARQVGTLIWSPADPKRQPDEGDDDGLSDALAPV